MPGETEAEACSGARGQEGLNGPGRQGGCSASSTCSWKRTVDLAEPLFSGHQLMQRSRCHGAQVVSVPCLSRTTDKPPPPFAVCLLIIGPACPRPATQPSQQRSLGEQATLGTQAGPGLWGWPLSAQVSSRGCLLFRVSCPPRDACRVTGVRLGTQGHKKDAHGGTARPPVTHKMPTSPQGAGRCHSRCTTPGSEGAFIHDVSHPSCLFLVPEAWQGLSQEPRAVWSSCMGASPRGTALPRIEGRIRVQEAPLRVGGSGWAVSPCAQDLGRSQGLHWCPELLRTPPPHLLLLQGPVCPAGSHCHVFLPRRRTATGDGRSA